jgi:hypothetical protein
MLIPRLGPLRDATSRRLGLASSVLMGATAEVGGRHKTEHHGRRLDQTRGHDACEEEGSDETGRRREGR